MLTWKGLLNGLAVKKLQGNIYRVNIQGLGATEVGPYKETLKFVGGNSLYKLPVQVHHIVNGEHLDGTGWSYDVAPCVVLEKVMHEQYHGRMSETLPEYHGRTDVGKIGHRNKLALYYDMFVEQFQWNELWTIAARIITGKTQVPDAKTFQDQ